MSKISTLVLVACLSVLASSSEAKREVVHKGSLQFGAQERLLGKRCYVFGGSITSGDFFDHLKRTDTLGQIRFSKNKEPVTNYPESLSVLVRISAGECRPNSQPAAGDSAIENIWELLKFKAEWKDELRVSPARYTLLAKREIPYPIYPKTPQSFEMRVFEYQLEVSAKDVPLTSHLIVSICWPDAGTIARLSAQP